MCVHQQEHKKKKKTEKKKAREGEKKKKSIDIMELHLCHLPVSAKGTGQASGRLGNESTTNVLETQ